MLWLDFTFLQLVLNFHFFSALSFHMHLYVCEHKLNCFTIQFVL
jgi:hypothetical protein